jgi:hypothetical protein
MLAFIAQWFSLWCNQKSWFQSEKCGSQQIDQDQEREVSALHFYTIHFPDGDSAQLNRGRK